MDTEKIKRNKIIYQLAEQLRVETVKDGKILSRFQAVCLVKKLIDDAKKHIGGKNHAN